MSERAAVVSSKPVTDASTVILLREKGAGLETFMLCRHARSGFLGGAHVFPGGKVDAGDCDPGWQKRFDRPSHDLAGLLGEEHGDGALGLWVAAIRETFEEAGVLIADCASAADLYEARKRLNTGTPFLDIAAAIELAVHSTVLTPYARWVTPKMESKRFDTRFFVAALPKGQLAAHDGTETTSAVWLRPDDALCAMHDGAIKLAPPTVHALRWLTELHSIEAAIEGASSQKPPLVRPRVVADGQGWFLALPGDPAHPEQAPVLPGSTRMVLEGSAWIDAPQP